MLAGLSGARRHHCGDRDRTWRSLSFAFAHRGFRASPRFAVTGILIGLIVVGRLVGHGHRRLRLVRYAADRVLHFRRPARRNAALRHALDRAVARLPDRCGDRLHCRRVMSQRSRDGSFRWQIPASVSEFKRRLVGAFLMGFGGITALGCTIGQGVTGVSTLSVGSVIAHRLDRRRRTAGAVVDRRARTARRDDPMLGAAALRQRQAACASSVA